MYYIKKIQWKSVYTRWTEGPSTWKNLNSLILRYQENSMENCVY